MRNTIIVRKDDKYIYTLELWGASTKHPDSIFHYSDYKKVDWLDDRCQVFQWLLECASKLTFPFHAKCLTEYALRHWCNWGQGNLALSFCRSERFGTKRSALP